MKDSKINLGEVEGHLWSEAGRVIEFLTTIDDDLEYMLAMHVEELKLSHAF